MRVLAAVGCMGVILCTVSGCVLGNRPNFVHAGTEQNQKTFYLDGAGNMGFGKETVPLGLADAGYQGQVEHFIWTTYLGLYHDQVSIEHNRTKGRELARRIETFLTLRPNAEVNIIALSAGTGVAVFALENLGTGFYVQSVVMLSSSLSSDYDLTPALKRVKGGMYFFWSPADPILKEVIPWIGTVDGSVDGQRVAGITGAKVPSVAGKESQRLYFQKLRNIEWEPVALWGPIKLRHAGSADRAVIREMVAPIIVGKAANKKEVLFDPSRVSTDTSSRPLDENSGAGHF